MVIAIRYFADDAEATQKLEELSVSTPKPAEEDEVLPAYSSPPGRCCCSTSTSQVKKLPGGKTKKKEKPRVVLTRSTRNKRKAITTINGLDMFGIKLPVCPGKARNAWHTLQRTTEACNLGQEAAKKFGKRFACGASVVKDASNKEEIDVQVHAEPIPCTVLLDWGGCLGRLYGGYRRLHPQRMA